MSLRFIEPKFGLENFSLNNSSNDNIKEEDVGNFLRGSIQLDWINATSSDAFLTPGVFAVYVSNNRQKWQQLLDSTGTPVTIPINAANGTTLVRRIIVDFHFIKLAWTKNNSTGGIVKCTSIFKRGSDS